MGLRSIQEARSGTTSTVGADAVKTPCSPATESISRGTVIQQLDHGNRRVLRLNPSGNLCSAGRAEQAT